MLTLVTGATGLVGNNVVRRLLAEGQPVRALVRSSGPPRALSGLGVELVRGSICNFDDSLRACDGVERVIHCAGHVQIGWSNLAMHRAVNVGGTRHMAAASRAVGARMIHVSSVDAMGMGTREHPADEEQGPTPHILCPYVTSKREAELAVEREMEAGLDAVIVNPNFVLGPWDWKPSSGRMLLEIARGRGLIAPPGGNDFCDARDVADGIIAAAERGQSGRRYILGGVPLSYVEAWRLFAKASGVRAPLAVTPKWLLRIVGLAGDMWGRVRRKEPDVNSAATAISAQPHHYSSARAIAELGYHVRDIQVTIADTWEWFLRAGYC